ncbi:Peptidase family M1 [Ekhidna lutea]|uniref:Peptidase family M1 n=1 Tax=Ekhidna lutea TaxID=447679 RepID=A0A239F534_EKHLU|nr:M1 family metallopeptidase [Ekhidna lutea]SNS51851.1 Peptidase family M1 [Ekhidna lutea]
MKKSLSILIILVCIQASAQTGLFDKQESYTRQDSLRGSITPERVWWDLKYYDLFVAVDPEKKFISGTNKVTYAVLEEADLMQIDLQEPMQITKVTQGEKELEITHEGNAHFIKLPVQTKGTTGSVTIHFEGNPREAIRAPWDGGYSWKKDENGNHFIATSNQGIGASLWWPCKDHMYDEPDNGMTLSIQAPEELTAVGNGRLEKIKKNKDGTRTFIWKVVNPINNYGVNVNIGDYVNISSKYKGEKGNLDVDFWVLSYNKEKAKDHFEDAYRTLEAFEHWFGPYPFYEDSYKLVEVPYLGMEHQSSVTYGNQYLKGYLGQDISGTGWGLKWDYIIIHETGHEWFANNITYKDMADMWVHEGFTTYSESLFVEYFYGKEAASEYTRGLRLGINNRETIIGDYDVNSEGSKDMYPKGNNLLHTVRQLVNDDEKWRSVLRGLNKDFYHQMVSSQEVESYISEKSGVDLSDVFDQYLRDARVPVLEYAIRENQMIYRWTNCIESFDMPVKVLIGEEEVWLKPTTSHQVMEVESKELDVDNNFYIYANRIM